MSKKPTISFQYIDFDKLIFLENNPRTRTAKGLETMATDIKADPTFYENRPTLVNFTDGEYRVYAGDLRAHAAHNKLGWKQVPCNVENDVPQKVMERRAILDNTHREGWDSEKMEDWDFTIEDFVDMGVPEFVFGLDDEGEGGIPNNALNSEAQEDDFEPSEIETVKTDIVLGDLFEIGTHRLLCGDSTKAEDVERLMCGEKADMVFTDPPYGIGIDGQKKSIAKNPKHNRKAHEFMGWDSERPNPEIFKQILSLSIPTVIFGGNYFADLLPPSRCWIYWSKGQDGLTMSDGELAWTNLEKPLRAVTVNRANLGDTNHPTQKPVTVVSFCLDYVGEAKRVVDFFAGSGTTMVSCHKSNRRAYCLEISEKYCQVIISRMLKLDPTLEIKKNGQPYKSPNVADLA